MAIVRNLFKQLGRLVKGVRVAGKYNETASGTNVLAASDAADRNVLIVARVTEAFANGTGGQPTFAIGQVASTSKFAATSAFTNAPVGTVLTFAGLLSATRNFIVTAVAATGTGTGSIEVEAIVLPSTF